MIPHKGLIVSCQSFPGEALYGSHYMVAMAKAAIMGGAVAIRTNGLEEIKAIKQAVTVPVIGLLKHEFPDSEVFITPTLEDAAAVYESGADIVAIDATRRQRPDGLTLQETIGELKKRRIPIMADVSTYQEGIAAAGYGVDYVSTTLSGYTSYSRHTSVTPDLELVELLSRQIEVPIAAEGRIRTPGEALQALQRGASYVVVGAAITRPHLITQAFVQEMKSHAVPK